MVSAWSQKEAQQTLKHQFLGRPGKGTEKSIPAEYDQRTSLGGIKGRIKHPHFFRTGKKKNIGTRNRTKLSRYRALIK